ncbi:hypothetical protein F1188_17555 [Roseospira marina]|uniref:4-oxalocrotonate tautomerase n=1 Tax=Roseospira marina TaxID=140057 RepID=A0A5M6I859_9PROT|nr:hypothetical protein [Roseospira marina]KAA5604097.1 hypothetical protein F1188_17555 [Roseospira marina]MBB4315804.1 4-oxalocrotonate tautomerase [Roseospira marina]MBB5088957.1 4-oxalocrotonate tautomerase [Roseospira marina]
MPFARLTLIPQQPPEIIERLTTDLTDLIAADLGKRHELTSVLIETPSRARWTIGAGPQPTAAHLEICVTAGTNSADEKRRFIRHAMDRLRQAIPALPEASYVVVRDLPGGDWGYDGRTQADRARHRP